MSTAHKKVRTLKLDFDLGAAMTGFGSATRPTPAHHTIMKHYSSPLLMGPPPSDMLLEIVMHMFTDEEAEFAALLPPLRPRTAAKVAKLAGRPVDEVERVLHNLAFNKIVLLASGDPRKYTILPIVPGTFEMALMTNDLSTRNAWHQKFAALFERLWETGYLAQYASAMNRPPVRYLPVTGLTKTLYMAWPSDLLEEILEPYHDFAVGHCQCRLAMQLVDKGCGKSTENCTVFGPLAKPLVERGMMRKSDRREILEIKKKAELEGLVTWTMNDGGDNRGNGSCSCCGCCCHALRGVRDFNTPGLISKPHFMPARDVAKCTVCAKCVKACPMGAWTLVDKTISFNRARCIGCGLCAAACKKDALKLEPVPDARPPLESMRRIWLGMAPGYLKNSVRIWAKRLFT
jgi:Pyruvate/2-oxoacid:ferredoxin oxidoreductase delta subunit